MNSLDNSFYLPIVTQINLGIIAVSEDMTVAIWNHWVAEKSGINESTAINQPLLEVLPELSNTRIPDAIKNCFEHGLPAIISNVFNRSPFPFYTDASRNNKLIQNINIIPVQYNDKTLCILQINDISASVEREAALEQQVRERKIAEEKLTRTLQELEKASSIKSDFLASMSHEIRTPMNGIIGMVRMLQNTQLDNTQSEHLRIIDDSVHSLLTIINDILDFSKIEAGKLNIEHADFNLKTAVNDVLDITLPAASHKSLSLSVEYDSKLKGIYNGDSTRIKQILLNLVSNAIKFSETGAIQLVIEVIEEFQHAQKLKFSVIDSGIGIDADALGDLFEHFTQADNSTTRQYGGTGLGLAISKKLVELMSGTINVNTKAGSGSHFWFEIELPIGKKTHDNPSKERARNPLRDKLDSLNYSGDVLLVEDVIVNQIVAKTILKELGFNVVIASNGQEAVEAFKQQSFKLIFMDCQMPVKDGYEATREIRQLEEDTHTPIIALTALVMKGDKEKCYAAGMDDYISKPYAVEKITSCVERWL